MADPVQDLIMQILTARQEPSKDSPERQRLNELADRIFGSYGYDFNPGDPRDIYTPGLPEVGAGRYRVSPPMRSYGLDPDLQLYRGRFLPSEEEET